jgi:hypothetical protein
LRRALPGVAVFAALAACTFFRARGSAFPDLAPPLAEKGSSCVEDRAFMASSHMALLAGWRDAAVRGNTRRYVALDGRAWEISLEKTCFSCHTRKSAFCDSCHASLLASPSCWECHVIAEAAE